MDKSLARGYRKQIGRNAGKSQTLLCEEFYPFLQPYIMTITSGKRLKKPNIKRIIDEFERQLPTGIMVQIHEKNCNNKNRANISFHYLEPADDDGPYVLSFQKFSVTRRRIVLETLPPFIRIENHAIDRFIQRVDQASLPPVDYSEFCAGLAVLAAAFYAYGEPYYSKPLPIVWPYADGLLLGLSYDEVEAFVSPEVYHHEDFFGPGLRWEFDKYGQSFAGQHHILRSSSRRRAFIHFRTFVSNRMMSDTQIRLHKNLSAFININSPTLGQLFNDLHSSKEPEVGVRELMLTDLAYSKTLNDAHELIQSEPWLTAVRLPKAVCGQNFL